MATIPVGGQTTVPVKSKWTSKISWTQGVGMAASVAAFFGLNISAAELTAIILGIQAAQSVGTVLIRTFWTKSIVSSST